MNRACASLAAPPAAPIALIARAARPRRRRTPPACSAPPPSRLIELPRGDEHPASRPPGSPAAGAAHLPRGVHAEPFTAARPQAISGSAYHPRLLVVDDNPGELGVLTEAVSIIDGAAAVDSCTTGQLAMAELSVLAQQPHSALPDLVVIDIHMPLISGPELLSGIRSLHELERLRVVMITGGTIPAERRRCVNLGALAVIDKPGNFAGFLDLARQLVDLARGAAAPAPSGEGADAAPAAP